MPFFIFFSFTVKNEGNVSLNFSWCVQPGTYRPPTPVEDVKVNKSARSKGTSSQASKAQSLASRQSGTKAKQDKQNRQRTGTMDERSLMSSEPHHGRISQMAHSVDGRPTSAMTVAFDACSVTDPVNGS